jgi:hypothetical protein
MTKIMGGLDKMILGNATIHAAVFGDSFASPFHLCQP